VTKLNRPAGTTEIISVECPVPDQTAGARLLGPAGWVGGRTWPAMVVYRVMIQPEVESRSGAGRIWETLSMPGSGRRYD
jgi:hypothetical protein